MVPTSKIGGAPLPFSTRFAMRFQGSDISSPMADTAIETAMRRSPAEPYPTSIKVSAVCSMLASVDRQQGIFLEIPVAGKRNPLVFKPVGHVIHSFIPWYLKRFLASRLKPLGYSRCRGLQRIEPVLLILVVQGSDRAQVRRLSSIAAIYDGLDRRDAARIGGMDRQILCDWVHWLNADGPDGLIDRWAGRPKPRLASAQKEELSRIVEEGPDPDKDGVVRWRCLGGSQNNFPRTVAGAAGHLPDETPLEKPWKIMSSGLKKRANVG